MINGEMSESQKGYAVLEEVEDSTFDRFLEWAYRGYYTSGDFVPRLPDDLQRSVNEVDKSEKRLETPSWEPPSQLPQEEGLSAEPELAELDWKMCKSARGKKKPRFSYDVADESFIAPAWPSSSRDMLKDTFIHRKSTVRQERISIPPPRPNQSSEEDYTNVFLSHAQLYVFAEKYDVQLLRILALENLQNVLAIFTLHKQRTRDIIALLRYIYANTGEPVDGEEDLRMLMRQYVGYQMDTLMDDKEFGDLIIENGGALLGDFMKMVTKRIS